MMPKKITSQKIIEKRKKAFDELRTTNHWANKILLFPKSPRTYGKELPNIKVVKKPKLTELGKTLI